MATEETKPVEREISIGLTERRIRGRIQAHGGLAGIGDILADFRQASAAAALERAAQIAQEKMKEGMEPRDDFYRGFHECATGIYGSIRALKGSC